jgi:hypothetical protein
MKRGWRIALGGLTTLACLLIVGAILIGPTGAIGYVPAVLIFGISTAGDAGDCGKIIDMFLQRHEIPKTSKSKEGHPPVFCNPGASGLITTPPTVVIYEATNPTTQEQYLATLKSIQQQAAFPNIRVEFYESENWTEWRSDRASGGNRGPERLLRKESLVL